MPSWNIHLAIAKDVNKKLKMDKNSFYLGNTLPDVDYGMNITRKETHFYNLKCKNCPSEILPNINEFLKKYKKNINNPLIMGMYVHILTDYFYNNYIFSNCWVQNDNNEIIGIKLNNGKIIKKKNANKKILKYYKHKDLENYGKYLYNNNKIEMPKYDNNIITNLKDLYIEDYTENMIRKRINYLNNRYLKSNKYKFLEKILGLKYKMLSKDELDNLYLSCIKYIEKNIEN